MLGNEGTCELTAAFASPSDDHECTAGGEEAAHTFLRFPIHVLRCSEGGHGLRL